MRTVPLTGWMFTDATRQVDCPRCGEKAGQDCKTPKRRVTRYPHTERTNALVKLVGRDNVGRGRPSVVVVR